MFLFTKLVLSILHDMSEGLKPPSDRAAYHRGAPHDGYQVLDYGTGPLVEKSEDR